MEDYSNKSVHALDSTYYLPVFKRFPITFVKGEGSKLTDADGKTYIDALAGIAVNSVGHCHPHVVTAICKQASELMHISNFFSSIPQATLAEKLAEISGLSRVFMTNSGAEAVEGAIKIARKYAHQKGKGGHIISMHNSFHGRTLATIATGKKQYQQGFAPIPGGFSQVPFNDIKAIEDAIHKDTAAIIIEPVQGEGGIHVAEKAYLEKLRRICDKEDILLIFDEIQCGIGRTGKMFAKDIFGVQPDVMTLAKALGSGMPVGAFLCNEKVAEALDYGDHGTTFGGNLLACSAALATIKVIEKENLTLAASTKGKWLMTYFLEKQKEIPEIKEVRGLGLMFGVEFTFETPQMIGPLLERGIVANATAGNVIRLVPPLNISDEDLTKIAEQVIEVALSLKKTPQA